jgi:hypothetical protein
MTAHSQIVVAQAHSPMLSLPGGFDDVDIAVLEWTPPRTDVSAACSR